MTPARWAALAALAFALYFAIQGGEYGTTHLLQLRREEAEERAQRLISKLRKPAPKLADWLDETIHDTLTFLDRVAPEHRRLLKTTNSMEHDHAEVRRRSRVVRIFPNEAALIRLLGALAIERNEQWLERRYMAFKPEAKQEAVTHAA